MRTLAPTTLLIAALFALATQASAQAGATRTMHWVGGSGAWDDAAHWSVTPGGPGGAGVPRIQDAVVIAPNAPATINMPTAAVCAGLAVSALQGAVTIQGATKAEWEISGGWTMQGDVRWEHQGTVRLTVRKQGVEVDTRAIPIASDLVLDGSGAWSVISDLVLRDDRALVLKQGTLIGNQSLLQAGEFRVEGRGQKSFQTDEAVVMLAREPLMSAWKGVVRPGDATWVVAGLAWEPGFDVQKSGGGDRDVNICGTGPGQTPFVVDAQVTSNYNGFGVRCRGDCNATVTVTVSGGVGPFTYQWLNGGPSTQTWTTACGGPQIVIVTDVGQGVSCPVSVNVTEPSPLGVIFFGPGTPPSCPGVCDGTRTALGIGGVAPIEYDWNDGAGTNSAFFALCPGANTLVVTDANDCQFDTTFVFDLQPILPNLITDPISCFGSCDGTAEVDPQGGTPTYTISWDPAPPIGQGTTAVSGLCAGNWEVTITDANACDTTVAFVIDGPPPLDIDITIEDASCFGDCDGTATVIPSGSPGPFSFSWSPEPGAGQGSGTATDLCAGDYEVLITDLSSGCDTLVAVTILSPAPFEVDATVTDASCSDVCDGVILCGVSGGGSPPYQFVWSPVPPVGQGTPEASGLCPGEWILTITDALGCDTTLVFTVGAPPPLEVDPAQTDVTCYSACDGSATAPTSGGTGPYTFLWSPDPPEGQGTDSASELCAGLWTLLITDDNGCDTTLFFNIEEPPIFEANASTTDVSCGGLCDGTATVDPVGGTPDYTYEWFPTPPAGQGTSTASELCAGVWVLSVIDANGCKQVVPFTIEDAAPLELSLNVEPASCPGVCDGSAEVVVTGGTAPYTFLWSPEPFAGQGTANVSGLCGQAYTLTVTDSLGCDTTIAFAVDVPEAIEANAILSGIDCAGDCNGSIVLAPTGGMGIYSYEWSPLPPIGQGTASVSGLCAGDWTVTITSGGCDTTITYNIPEPPPLDAGLVITNLSCAGDCDGSAEVDPSGGTPGYTITWVPEPPNGQGGTTATGLCPGNYEVILGDVLGCELVLPFEILGPQPLEVTLELTEAGCDGACLGTATATVIGGEGPYIYNWQPPPPVGQGTDSISGLCPGPYTLIVTDATGCDTTVTFIILQPSGIQALPTVTDASCFDACDGAISVDTDGGTPPYTYTWTPEPPVGQGTADVSQLCPGEWTLFIADAIACDTLLVITVGAPPFIEPNAGSTNESCEGPCDGTATVDPIGGEGPYTFQWTPMPQTGQGTPSAGGLCAGEWSVTITDVAGCDTTVTFLILEQQPILPALVTTDVSCNGACDGTASVTPSGGVEPFTILWQPEPGLGQGTTNASELCAGPWSVTITDFAGCDTTLQFVIAEPPPIVIELSTTAADCFDPCSGTATVVAGGGSGDLVILWQPEPGGGQGSTTATELCADTAYTVTITDENGCTLTQEFMIAPFDAIVPNSSSTPATCADSCDGTATVDPTGGQGPYTFQWSPEPGGGQGTAQATGLCPGVVEVTITDVDGCSTVAAILILSPEPVTDGAVVTNLTCGGACSGSIVLNPDGGNGPYTFLWDPVPPNGQGSNGAFDLCAGEWSVIITDVNGCQAAFSYDITEPPPLEVAVIITPSECQLCIGGAQVLINGGTTPILVVWTDALGNIVGIGDNIANVCAGIYTVTVTDNSGCEVQLLVPIADSDGEIIAASATPATCPGACDGSVTVNFDCADPPCVIAWTDVNGNVVGDAATVNGLCDGTYFVTVTNASGCVSIDQTVVTSPPPIQATVNSNPVSCAGDCDGWSVVGLAGGTPPFVLQWSPEPGAGQGTPFASELCAGAYTLTITDGGGCQESVEVLITEPDPLLLDAVVQSNTCTDTCDATIVITPSGGTAPYTYAWSPVPPNGQGSNGAFGLCAGTWTVDVIDAAGCLETLQIQIDGPPPLQLEVSSTMSTCPDCDGTATVVASGGSGPYTYAWTLNGSPVGDVAEITGLCAGLYLVTVTDPNGCSAQAFVPVTDANAEVLDVTDGQVGCAGDCDGSVSVAFDCGATPCTILWVDDEGDTVGNDVNTVDGLCAGEYLVLVTNADGCMSIATATVTPTTEIISNLSSTAVSCPGACDGTATVGPTGGAEPYTYQWSPEPGTGQGTAQVTGLCAGVYAVLITDATGCDTTITVLILEPGPIQVFPFTQQATCAGACTGGVTVTTTGGVGPYDYFWSPEPANGQGGPIAEGLCAGIVTLLVTDANGCTITETFIIDQPGPIVITATATPSACGECIGTATATAQGGTPGYGWYWTTFDGEIQGTGDALTGLCAGLYFATAIDANGCSAQQLVPLEDVDGEDATTTDGLTTCPGDCDGTVTVDVDCVDAPCTTTWYDVLGNELGADATLNDLCAGLYLALITNASGCITIDTAFVLSPDPILANLSTTPVTCFGDCDGTATVDPSGGIGPYTIEWVPEPPNGQGGTQALQLCAGTSEVIITDAVGCSITQGVLILSPDLITAGEVLTPPTCQGDCNGSIVLSPQGGTGPYSYVWDPVPPNGQGSNGAFDLCAGEYAVTIADVNGCMGAFEFTLIDPVELVADIALTHNGCFGVCEGTATADVSGGVPGYTLTWFDPDGLPFAQDVMQVTGLCGGTYLLVVTDAVGCVLQQSITITEGQAIESGLIFSHETCFGPCDGSASISPAGGDGGPYTVLWQPGDPVGQGTDQVSGLCAGEWSVTITDNAGCDTTETFLILPYETILDNAVVSDVVCGGECTGGVLLIPTGGLGAYDINWSPEPGNGQGTNNATGLCAGAWSVTIADAVGCAETFNYVITEPPPLEADVEQVTEASCADANDGSLSIFIDGGVPPYDITWTGPGGFTSDQEDLNDLFPGTYQGTVTDDNGCTVIITVQVGALNPVIADAGIDQESCFGVVLVLDGSNSVGGSTFQWTNDQGEVVGDEAVVTITDLAAGVHTFTLVVSDGPCSDSDEVTITVLALPIAEAGPDQTIFFGDVVTLGGSPSGPSGSVFSWQPDSLLANSSTENPSVQPPATTWFVLTVTAPDGCIAVDSVLITVLPMIDIPTGFTPNGDGWNDQWIIDNIDQFPQSEVEIYNRWGEMLFRSVGYNIPWDGRYNNGPVPVGTYYYVVKLNDPRFPDAYTGPLTVIR